MSAGVYTTTVDILGEQDERGEPVGGEGVTHDEWGDPVDGEGVLLADVPATIVERRIVVATESAPQAVTVHYCTGRLPAGTPVEGKRLRDADGTLYLIDHVNAPTNPALPAEVRLDLRRVT